MADSSDREEINGLQARLLFGSILDGVEEPLGNAFEEEDVTLVEYQSSGEEDITLEEHQSSGEEDVTLDEHQSSGEEDIALVEHRSSGEEDITPVEHRSSRSQGIYYYNFRQSLGRKCLSDRNLTLSKYRLSYFAKYLPSLDSSRRYNSVSLRTKIWIRHTVFICLALAISIKIVTHAWRYTSSHSIDKPLTPSLPQQFDCNNNGVHFDFSPFLDLYQLDKETHQAAFNKIGHVELYEDLVSSYFVGRATLKKTVLHLTGRFACMLREYSTSDSEILHADIIGEVELLAKELSSLLSLLSQLMGLSNAIYSRYSTSISTAAAEADLLRPNLLNKLYLLYEPPELEFVLRLIGCNFGEKWLIQWEGRKVTMELAQLGLSTIERELSSLDQILKMIEELRWRIERLPQLLWYWKGWRFTLRQHILRFIDFLLLPPQETIERRVQEMNEKSNMLRSWYRDNIVWNLLFQDAALIQPLQPCSWGVQLNCSQ